MKSETHSEARILIVGSPNVGKSALFNRLTGQYVTVSNYPGTTVEVARGHSAALGRNLEVVDTPGMYSLLPITEEERVASQMLFTSRIQAVIHVVDAKNIDRMLGFTLQLIEARLPVILALNMFDEARHLNIRIDVARLRARLGIPVIPTVSITGEGLAALVETLRHPPVPAPFQLDYGPVLEQGLRAIGDRLPAIPGPIAARTRACLLLMGDEDEKRRLMSGASEHLAADVLHRVAETRNRLEHAPQYYVTLAMHEHAEAALAGVVEAPARGLSGLQRFLDRLCTNPWTGYPLLLGVLYFALYKFVGGFGAGTAVGFLEERVFGAYLNPWLTRLCQSLIPWPVLRELFVGDYGVFTLGLRYAVAIILPIVGSFFLMFALLEDSGYLPRLALLADRLFKRIGLNGRAVIPMTLGFGCDTMATLVTRTLETRRERLICTLLLALAVPCSAQLGVILALLATHRFALFVWLAVILAVTTATGLVVARFLPGKPVMFYMELPPLRLPTPLNVAVKTYSRMIWYFQEILPLFLLISLLIWIGRITAIFDLVLKALQPVMSAIGLPAQAAVAFLFGFFRRDYGAAGLYDLQRMGALSGNQLTVAAITLTLFLPCVAQYLVMHREQGWRAALLIACGVLLVAFATGWAVNAILTFTGVVL
jgi:ferrous iron transport protein B